MSGIAPTTLQSYQAAFKLFIRHGCRTGVLPARLTVAQFAEIPIFRWAALIKSFSILPANRRSYARQAYSALLLFPSLHLLRFEQSLKQLKRFWNVSTPRYSSFYDCRVLIKTLMSTDFTVSEEALRLRAIITMRVLSLFRGIDLARTSRDIERGAVVVECLLRALLALSFCTRAVRGPPLRLSTLMGPAMVHTGEGVMYSRWW